MFQPQFNGTFPANDLSSSSIPSFQLSRIHQSSQQLQQQQQQLQQQHFHQQLQQHRQKNIFPSMDRSPLHNQSPEQSSTKPSPPSDPAITCTPTRFISTTPTSRPLPHHPSSPPPVTSNPENNTCRLMDYRNQAVAAFTVDSRELICLPQAFELFLKHLVGGLHTVYTKLKRLDVVPVVCNVEQVRVLRSLGAIQPGVNRCKLISPKEFDILYEDCTNSSARPGRPPKRSGNVGMTADVLKKQRLQINNDYFPHPVPSSSYPEVKKASFPHPYFSLAEPKPSLLPSYPINFLPFGHPGFMNFMASHLAPGRNITPSLFDFNASARYTEFKYHQQQQTLALLDKKGNNEAEDDEVIKKNKQRVYSPYGYDDNNNNNNSNYYYNNNNKVNKTNNNNNGSEERSNVGVVKLTKHHKHNENSAQDYSNNNNNNISNTKNNNNNNNEEDYENGKIFSSQQQQQQIVFHNNQSRKNNNCGKQYDVIDGLKNGDVGMNDGPLNLEILHKHGEGNDKSTNQKRQKGGQSEEEEEEEEEEDGDDDDDVRRIIVDVINKDDAIKVARTNEAEQLVSRNAHVDTPEIVTMEMMLMNLQAILKMVAEKMRDKNDKHSIEKENLLRLLEKERRARKALETKMKLMKNDADDDAAVVKGGDDHDNEDGGRDDVGVGTTGENRKNENCVSNEGNGDSDDGRGRAEKGGGYSSNYDLSRIPLHAGIPHQVIQSPSSIKESKYSTPSKDNKYSFSGKDFKYPVCVSTSPLFKIFNQGNEDAPRSEEEEEEDEDNPNDSNISEHGREVGQTSPVTSPDAILTQLKNQSGQFLNGSSSE